MMDIIAQMQLSDWLMVAFTLGVLIFTIDYGVFSPWWTHPIGYVVMIYNISVLMLMFLILYGLVAGQRVEEWARVPVAFLLTVGIAGKLIILHVSRHEGKIARRKAAFERARLGQSVLPKRRPPRPDTLLPTGPNPIVKNGPSSGGPIHTSPPGGYSEGGDD